MNTSTTPAPTVTATLERLDVRIWADKCLRECTAIAGREAKRRGRVSVDPVRLAAVLDLLIKRLQDERQALTERGELPY